MRVPWVLLLWSRMAVATSDWDRAADLAARWRAGTIEVGALAVEVARVPWPLVPAEVERVVSGYAVTGDVPPPWARDRLLPVLAGELPASGELVDAMLALIGPTSAPSLEGLAAARRSYAGGRPSEAVRRYRMLEGTSEVWREAAWTHYVAGDDARALGMGVTLAAPWLPSEDHAEGRLSTAMVMRDRCRFDEARRLVAPLLVAPPSEPPGNLSAVALAEGEVADGLVREVRAAPVVRRLREVLGETSAPETAAGEALRQATNERITGSIRRAWDEAAEARRSIAERALSLRYDTLRAERALRSEGWTPQAPAAAEQPPVGDDEIVWTFRGIWWLDELGLYRSLAATLCPADTR